MSSAASLMVQYQCFVLFLVSLQRTFYGETWTFGTTDRSAVSPPPDSESGSREYPIDMEFRDTAYTNIGIGVHNDGTYWTIPPGIQVRGKQTNGLSHATNRPSWHCLTPVQHCLSITYFK